MRKRLLALEEKGTPIRVAIIGCGRFGSMMVAQIMRAPGMHLAVACDLDPQRALESLQRAGYVAWRLPIAKTGLRIDSTPRG